MSPAKVSAAEAAIEAARKATSPPNGDQPPHGIMTLDYVKNKIVEAMKKQGEEDPASTSTSSGATKRASPDMASEDASSPKKKKTEDDVQAPSTAQLASHKSARSLLKAVAMKVCNGSVC